MGPPPAIATHSRARKDRMKLSRLKILPGAIVLATRAAGSEEQNENGRGGGVVFDDGFAQRQQDFLDLTVNKTGNGDIYRQMARLVRNMPVEEAPIRSGINRILNPGDSSTTDFIVMSLVRLLHVGNQYPERLSLGIVEEISDTLVGYRYWWDDPRPEIQISATENHQITYHASEFLIGQLFPTRLFTSGKTGAQHMETSKKLILQWCRNRMRFGYSEWLSDTYYGIDIGPLVSLVDFADDEEVRNHATIAMDLLVYDIALNSYQGHFGSTKGRSPGIRNRLDLSRSMMATSMSILFGIGEDRSNSGRSGVTLATSTGYQPPKVLVDIARSNDTFVTRQRNSILIEEGPKYGYGYDTLKDGKAIP
jgi:hypothetical protein